MEEKRSQLGRLAPDSFEIDVTLSESRIRQRYLFFILRSPVIYLLVLGYPVLKTGLYARSHGPLETAFGAIISLFTTVGVLLALFAFGLLSTLGPTNSTAPPWTYRFAAAGIQASRKDRSYEIPWSAVKYFKEAANAYYLGVRGAPKLLMIPRECLPGPEWVAAIQTWSGKSLRQARLFRNES